MNPTKYERFNRLFHIVLTLISLVKKLDTDKTQRGYLDQLQEEIDKLFLDNITEEKENERN